MTPANPANSSTPAEPHASGELPVEVVPRVVYISFAVAFACLIAVSWIMLGTSREADVALAGVAVLILAALALPSVVSAAGRHLRRR